MPLPLLIGIGAVVGGALAIGNAAGREVNEELELDLWSINWKIESLAKETNEKHKQAADSLNEHIGELNQYKKIIQTTVIIPYCKAFEKIHNISYQKFSASQTFDTEKNSLDETRAMVKEGKISWGAKKVAANISDGVASVINPICGGGIFVGKVLKGVKTMYKIDEAKEQLAMVKHECEKVNIETDLLNDTVNKIEELTKILEAITPLLNRATVRIEDNLKKFGSDYFDWDDEAQSLLWTSINIAAGMNKIITTPVTKDSGEINMAFVKVVEAAGVLPEGKPMDMESLQEKPEEYLYFCSKCLDDGLLWGDTDSKFFVFSSRYGNEKTNISPGENAEQLPESWRCPCCEARKDKLLHIPLCPASKEEIKKGISCIRTKEDFLKWVAGMMVLTEEEIRSLNDSDRKQAVENEIERLNNYYDDETLKEAVKVYGYFVHSFKWNDKNDREWMYTFCINPLRKFHRIRVEQISRLTGIPEKNDDY